MKLDSRTKRSIHRAAAVLPQVTGGGEWVIVKLVPEGGGCCCFHCWPEAWNRINQALAPEAQIEDEGDALVRSAQGDCVLECHESGPEVVVCLAVASAGLALAKSVVDLVTTIIKARADGAKKGDRSNRPLELIVRRIDRDENLQEKHVLRIESREAVDRQIVNEALVKALEELAEDASPYL